ncbi:MAG: SIS domain-containing protein [Acidobacteria bacterium]|nr:SIS domain-containing protein [Acidobacteriota bacterium]
MTRAAFAATIAAHAATLERSEPAIERAAGIMRDALAKGAKILIFGNGGSAADAQHFASELVNRFQKNRAAMAGLALTADASVITSIANDTSYDRVFARQIEALGREGDVAVGISTSGTSANVLAGLDQARKQKLATVALAGHQPMPQGSVDICVNVAASVTARVQEVHRTIIHVWCEALEQSS